MSYDFIAEYAKSNRSSCKQCQSTIDKDELRIGEMVQSPFHDGRIPVWRHVKCHFAKGNRGLTAFAMIEGRDNLRLADADKLKALIDPSAAAAAPAPAAAAAASAAGNDEDEDAGASKKGKKAAATRGKRKAEEPAEAPKKAARKEESAMNDDELIAYHNELMWELRDGLKKAMSELKTPTVVLRGMLDDNEISSKGGDVDLIQRIATCMLWGVPEKCPECSQGRLTVENGSFKCKSFANEWARCTFEADSATHAPFVVKEWARDVDFLANWQFVPHRRVLRKEVTLKASMPSQASSSSSSQSNAAAEDDNDLPFALGGAEKPEKKSAAASASSSSGATTSTPFDSMTIVFAGSNFSTTQKALGAIVKELGGAVATNVTDKTTIVISTPEEVANEGKKISDALERHIPILSEDVISKCKAAQKTLGFLEFWIGGSSEAKLALQPAEAANKALRNEKEKERYKTDNTTVKLVKKGRGAVDPAAGESVVRDYHVFDDTTVLWDAMMTLADLTSGNNSYYALQLLQHDSRASSFILFRKWGRVGTTIGANKSENFSDKSSAQSEFRRLFEEKTGNKWSQNGAWEKKPGKFYPVEITYDFEDDEEQAKRLKAASSGDARGSKLPKETQDLMKLIFNIEAMTESLVSMELDLKKMPLGKLSKRHIEAGYKVLKEIEAVLQNAALDDRKRNNDLLALNNKFYTHIPHDFGTEEPKLINSLSALKAKVEMMEALIDIEIATSLMLQQAGSTAAAPSTGTSVIDQNYAKLKTELDPLARGSDEWNLCETYLLNQKNNWKVELQSAFRVDREGESTRFQTKKHLGNQHLLWHGSGTTNYVGILSQGLRIAPPEAPVSGYRFGKGVYFADMCDKSIGYCRGGANQPILMMLCEVSLGTQKELFRDQYMEKPLPGSDSTKAMGRWIPDPKSTIKIENDSITVPMGKPFDSKVSSSCTHDELIVYDIAQVRIRYLLRINLK
ncbi:polymerase [Capsaspora owczarzaki ATCC 30864]|uniref:Poly [ADP-ribose] polymerase n=1 Tax=Capsaspora owczarzaki (strain ATCC 30864) TaxID=595528 RepID=A0A0D2WNS3_CAPO3|nr:polymerase [Capsaspora owczarzaki ATCC 30864]KJE92093.1 polymerase [Capsaspora owczarzaki ATCC 30864]|eukprot:XP_004363957.1 polymerase [Capsaspora owczarzaki ATCC 30864]